MVDLDGSPFPGDRDQARQGHRPALRGMSVEERQVRGVGPAAAEQHPMPRRGGRGPGPRLVAAALAAAPARAGLPRGGRDQPGRRGHGHLPPGRQGDGEVHRHSDHVSLLAGPAAALPLLDRLAEDPALRGSHRVWAARADVHLRAGETRAALADYERALDLVTNEAERRYLTTTRRLAEEEDPMPVFRKSPPELIAVSTSSPSSRGTQTASSCSVIPSACCGEHVHGTARGLAYPAPGRGRPGGVPRPLRCRAFRANARSAHER